MQIENPDQLLAEFGIHLTASERAENAHLKVVVGLSGGVDSSVCAGLLKLMGYEVVGLFMKNWEEEDGACTAEVDYQDVVRVCEHVGIAYYSVNFADNYRQAVFDGFLEGHRLGHTPNPDILCNKEIKFKVFYDYALMLGAHYLATGHYCQIGVDEHGKATLIKGYDNQKDQSYFLNAINGKTLERVLFPIGHLVKPQVRELARRLGIPTMNKKDSTGICFIGERDFKTFLGQYIAGTKGNFVHLESGRLLGTHDGACFYTIGQRKGLGVGGPGEPWFVVGKSITTNEVYLVQGEDHPALYAETLTAKDSSWINGRESVRFPLRCKAKIRYRQADQDCVVTQNENGDLLVTFDDPQRAITPWQSVAFYLGERCLGGARIIQSGETLWQKAQQKKLPQAGVVQV